MIDLVRIALPPDEQGILALCWQAHEERPERSLSRTKVIAMVKSCLGMGVVDNAGGIIGIVEVAGDVRAMCGLVISSAWCSEDKELYDFLVYVRPDCRHLRYLTPLLAFAQAQSDRLRIPLWMGWIGDERAEAKSKAYQRRFPKFGEFYRHMPT